MTIYTLDACCGSKMFWFDKQHKNVIFMDKRCEQLVADNRQGRRTIVISPDILACYAHLPFKDNCFSIVIFDPPHLVRNGHKSWMAMKYGTLKGDWKKELRRGFAECFRVLKPEGVLVFKWSELDIPLSQILALSPVRPLIGNRRPKNSKTHWILFVKQEDG